LVHQENKGEDEETDEKGRDDLFDYIAVKKLEHSGKYSTEKAQIKESP
jgi:hypothetical protein